MSCDCVSCDCVNKPFRYKDLGMQLSLIASVWACSNLLTCVHYCCLLGPVHALHERIDPI